MKLGDSFLMAVPPNYEADHLFFVVSDPRANGGTYIIVNITGDQFRAGKECILKVGDHPWIKKQSFVAFSDALEITPERDQKIIQALIGTKITLQASLPPDTLAKIIQAAKQSKAIPVAFKKYF